MNRAKRLNLTFACGLAVTLVVGLLVPSAIAADKADKKIRVAIALTGSIKDFGWFQGGYEAVVKLKEDPGVDEVAYKERVKVAEIERVMRRWAVGGYDLIFGHSFEFGEPARKLAPQFPNTVFAVPFFFATGKHPNLVNYGAQSHESVYLAGVLAALMSKGKKIGVIGGYPIPNQIAEHNAYKLGARSVVPKTKVVEVYVSSWFDVTKAKEAAIAMAEQGVDVIYTSAGPMGKGGIKGAAEKGILGIGTYMDWNPLAPDTVITSTMYVWHGIMKTIVLDLKKGKVKKTYLVGLAGGGSKLAPFNKKVSSEIAQKVQAVERDIKSGKLKVPYLGKKPID